MDERPPFLPPLEELLAGLRAELARGEPPLDDTVVPEPDPAEVLRAHLGRVRDRAAALEAEARPRDRLPARLERLHRVPPLARLLLRIEGALFRSQRRAAQSTAAALRELADGLEAFLLDLARRRLDPLPAERRLLARLERLERRMHDHSAAWALLDAEGRSAPPLPRVPAPADSTPAPPPTPPVPDSFYAGLTEAFRGPRDVIRERLRVHLDEVERLGLGTDLMPALDLGCGRGEWLELLRDRGLVARGVDLNETFLLACRARGLSVERGEALLVLRGLPAASLGLVSAFHLIEHLPLAALRALLHEMRRVLRPGGLALLETPNPDNLLVGARDFHKDPTHIRPLPAELLAWMLEEAGFREVRIRPLHPYPDSARTGPPRLDDLVCGPQDYAALARP